MHFEIYRGKNWNIQFIPRLGSFWIGAHYSQRYQSWCVALIPCLVFRFAKSEYAVDPGLWEKCS